MGATIFITTACGKTAAEAFKSARDAALHMYGHDGYTGTIAEKSKFREVAVSKEVIKDPKLLNAKIDELTDTEFDDKWGPAGCIKLKACEYVFFGCASE